MNKDTVSLRDIYDNIQKLRDEIQESYVQKNEFTPIKNVVYGLVGLTLVAVATAFLKIVVSATGR